MNPKQRVVLLFGIVIFAIMGLFPPWTVVFKDDGLGRAHAFLFSPPTENSFGGRYIKSTSIDFVLLLFQWFVVGATTAGLWWVFRGPVRPAQPSEGGNSS